MNNFKYVKIRNINALLVTYLLAAFSCQDTVRVDQFEAPDDVLQDASTAFIKSDSEGLVKDYSQISSGQALPEGLTITDPTDAQRIDNAVKGGRKIIFLRIADDADGREHALRTLASAAMRLQARTNDKIMMYNLNLEAINRLIATYKFTDEQARAYYVSVAKKLNDEKLSDKNVVVVDVDLLERGMKPDQLFDALAKPSIIALSKESKDTLKLTSGGQKSEEIRLSNLDPGEIFSLTNQRLSRSAGFKNDKVAAEKTSLLVAKVVAATDPKDNLGNFNRIVRAIRPVIEQEPLSATYEADITRAIANELGLDVNYVARLDIQQKSLEDIRLAVKDDPQVYSKQARQTEEILKRVNLLPDMKNLSLSSADLGQVENRVRKVVGDTESTLLSDAEHKRDDLQTVLEDAMRMLERRGQSQIEKAAKDIKTATTSVVRTSEQKIREENNENSKALTDKLDTTNSEITDTLKRAMERSSQRSGTELKQTITGAKNELARALEKAKQEINDNTNGNLKETEAHITATSDDIIARAQAMVQKAQGILDSNAQKRMSSAAERIIKEARAAVLEVQHVVNDHNDEQTQKLSDEVRNVVEKAQNKSEAALKQATERMNAKDLLRRTEQKLSDLGAVLEQLDKRVVDIGAELNDKMAKLPSRADQQKQLDAAVRRVNDHTKMDLARASERITDNSDANKQELKAEMDALRETLASRIKDAVARVAERAQEETKAINDNTNTRVKQVLRSLGEDIEEAKRQIDEVARELGAETLEQMRKLANQDRTYLKRLLIAHLYQSMLGVNVIAPPEVRNTFEINTKRPTVAQTPTHRQYDATSPRSMKRFQKELTDYLIIGMGI